MKSFFPIIFSLLAFPVSAAQLEGVDLPDRVRVDGQELQLNGIAVRTRVKIVKVYVAGLYLPHRASTAETALAARGAKRINLVLVRDATAEQFVDSIHGGMRMNHSEAELAKVKPQTDELMAKIRRIGKAKKGTSIVLDYAPSKGGTTLVVDGEAQGGLMAGEEFFRTLMRIWLGEHPVQADLKRALLGGRQ